LQQEFKYRSVVQIQIQNSKYLYVEFKSRAIRNPNA
jgi:hypothetical protein